MSKLNEVRPEGPSQEDISKEVDKHNDKNTLPKDQLSSGPV